MLFLVNEPTYMWSFTWVRKANEIFSKVFLVVFTLIGVYEGYLLFFTEDILMSIFSAFVGYILLVYSTLIPSCLYVIIKEALHPTMDAIH